MLKRKLIKYLNNFLKPRGVEIRRISGIDNENKWLRVHDPRTSYIEDPKLQELLLHELKVIASRFFTSNLANILPTDFDLKEEISHFWSIYRERPFGGNTGGSGFHNSFWIWLVARCLQGSHVIESGVWKGHTTWLLEKACPNSRIFGFDISLKNLEYHSDRISYIENDWKTHDFDNISTNSFVYFDCHINHAQRILEAYDKGFKHLLFDDNPPIYVLYAYGLPGYPTANMIYHSHGNLPNRIDWKWMGKAKSYSLDQKQVHQAKALIDKHSVFPNVGDLTQYSGFSFLTYVRLR